MERNVYIVQCNEFIKIGCAKSTKGRIKSLQTGNPYSLELIHEKCYVNAFDVEKLIHKQFKEYHHQGEWFIGLCIDDVIQFMDTVGEDTYVLEESDENS